MGTKEVPVPKFCLIWNNLSSPSITFKDHHQKRRFSTMSIIWDDQLRARNLLWVGGCATTWDLSPLGGELSIKQALSSKRRREAAQICKQPNILRATRWKLQNQVSLRCLLMWTFARIRWCSTWIISNSMIGKDTEQIEGCTAKINALQRVVRFPNPLRKWVGVSMP